jgi:hypothetical protein
MKNVIISLLLATVLASAADSPQPPGQRKITGVTLYSEGKRVGFIQVPAKATVERETGTLMEGSRMKGQIIIKITLPGQEPVLIHADEVGLQ